MQRIWHTLIVLWAFFLFGGCVIVDGSLDYRNNLSDYEAKKIVRKLFLSQESFIQAALLNSSGFSTILQTSYNPYETRYSCLESGYFTLRISSDLTSVPEGTDPLYLDYSECTYDTYLYPQSRLSGSVIFTYYQNMQDRYNKLLDFRVTYTHTYLYTSYGTRYLDGSVGIHYDEDYTRQLLRLTLSSSQLIIAESGYRDDRYENVVLDFTLDTHTGHYTYSYSGTLYNTYLGRLTYSTLAAMEGNNNGYPSYGEIKITNAHMSLIVRPLDDYYVDIEVRNHYYPGQNRIIHTTWINIGL